MPKLVQVNASPITYLAQYTNNPTQKVAAPRQTKYLHRCRSTPSSSAQSKQDTNYGFQVNERYLDWDESAARQLIRIYVATELKQTVQYVEEKLLELSVILPDLNEKLDKMNAQLVLQMVRDTEAVAYRMIQLRETLVNVNVSQVVTANPWLLTSPSVEELQAQLDSLTAALPGVRIDRLIETEPRLLAVDITKVLKEIERLLPGQDSVRVLVNDPGMVLGMRDAGLVPSMLIDDGIETAG